MVGGTGLTFSQQFTMMHSFSLVIKSPYTKKGNAISVFKVKGNAFKVNMKYLLLELTCGT